MSDRPITTAIVLYSAALFLLFGLSGCIKIKDCAEIGCYQPPVHQGEGKGNDSPAAEAPSAPAPSAPAPSAPAESEGKGYGGKGHDGKGHGGKGHDGHDDGDDD
jgi:hypothetical protein